MVFGALPSRYHRYHTDTLLGFAYLSIICFIIVHFSFVVSAQHKSRGVKHPWTVLEVKNYWMESNNLALAIGWIFTSPTTF